MDKVDCYSPTPEKYNRKNKCRLIFITFISQFKNRKITNLCTYSSPVTHPHVLVMCTETKAGAHLRPIGKKRTSAHTKANDSLSSYFFHSIFYPKRQNYGITVTWYIRRTRQELGRGEYALLYLPALGEELCGRHGKLQTVPDHLTGFQSAPAHHWRLHSPCVLLPKAVADFLEGHGVQALCVWNVKMQKSFSFTVGLSDKNKKQRLPKRGEQTDGRRCCY